MKKHIILLFTVITTLFSCTTFDHAAILEQLRDHEDRIQKLEAICNQLNSNVEAIQTILAALEQNDYITDITKITEAGVEIGYSITFAKGGTVNIYHGTYGSNAQAPKISIRKASDGEYYWTSDDEWLTDENGNKIPATVPDDPDGKYTTPHFRVAEGIWYISLDNGNTWQIIDSRTEDDESESIFKNITYDDSSVRLTLNDGTEIFVPRKQTAATLSLYSVSGNSATFIGRVIKRTPDMKISVYYSISEEFSIYNFTGSASLTDFKETQFKLEITGLIPQTRYYYFTQITADGTTTYSRTDTFTTTEGNPVADMLDLLFLADGTAIDISPRNMAVETKADSHLLVTRYDKSSDMYIACFDHSERYKTDTYGNHQNGYYKIDYSEDTDFIAKLSDGHSWETLFMLDAEAPTQSFHDKWFCSQQSGGAGFQINKKEDGQDISFAINLSDGATSSYYFANSGIVPVKDQWYHAVAVWDRDNNLISIYINGVKAATCDTPDNAKFVLNSSPKSHWLCIGADANDDMASHGWDGDVAMARIYDKALTDKDIEYLYANILSKWPSTPSISVSDVKLYSGLEVSEGWRYSIYGKRIKAGDEISLKSSPRKYECTTTSSEGRATIIIPDGLPSGTYEVVLERDTEERKIAETTLTVTPDAELPHETKVIAHRGYWHMQDGKNLPHNSIAALKRAQQLEGVYSTEFDVWLTKDNVLVINHDPTINGITIQNSGYDAIKDITLSNGEKLVTFDAFLAEYIKDTGIKLMIHVKDHSTQKRTIECTDAVISRLRSSDILDRAEWLMTNYEAAKHIIQECKDEVPDLIVDYSNDNVVRTFEELAADGMILNYNYQTVDKDLSSVKRAHDAGLQMVVYTINTEEQMLKYMALGVDYLNTDRPDLLIDLKKKTFIAK